MAYRFTDAGKYPYRPGRIFLGKSRDGQEVGIKLERGMVTVGGSRSGKGAGLIVQNCRKWTHNLLCIDPKGENVTMSWEAREKMGQKVYLLDPFHHAKDVPARLRKSFNVLGDIDPNSIDAPSRLRAIGDGLVINHNKEHMEWSEGSRDILSGICAWLVKDYAPEHRTLKTMRDILMQPDHIEVAEGEQPRGLYADAQRMSASTGCGGLTRAAGLIIQTALTSEKGMEKGFLAGARSATKWLDDDAISECLSSSTFDLNELKTGAASVFLVMPLKHLKIHAAFLRLFVSCALDVMQSHGLNGKHCLFILDEFKSLGKMEAIQNGFGELAGYNCHLWPFVQDFHMLPELYGDQGSRTFFTNSDALVFLGNSKDRAALEFVSGSIGPMTASEAATPPHVVPFDPIVPPVPRPFVAEPPPQQRSGGVHARTAVAAPRTSPPPGQNSGLWENVFHGLSEGLARSSYESAMNYDNQQAANIELQNKQMAAADANERAAWQSRNTIAEAAHRAEEDRRMREWQRDNTAAQERHNAAQRERQAAYEHALRSTNLPRVTPLEVDELTGKREGEFLARSMIVFAFTPDVLNIRPHPYFIEDAERQAKEKAELEARKTEQIRAMQAQYKAPRFCLYDYKNDPFLDYGLLILTNWLDDECRSKSITAETVEDMKTRIAFDLSFCNDDYQRETGEIKYRQFMREQAIRLQIAAIWIDHVANIMAKYDPSKFRFSFYDDDHSWDFFSDDAILDRDNVKFYVWSKEGDGMNLVEISDLKDFIPGGREYVEKGMPLVT